MQQFWKYIFPSRVSGRGYKIGPVCVSVGVSVWVYSGYNMHHYNGIWGTCAPSGRNFDVSIGKPVHIDPVVLYEMCVRRSMGKEY